MVVFFVRKLFAFLVNPLSRYAQINQRSDSPEKFPKIIREKFSGAGSDYVSNLLGRIPTQNNRKGKTNHNCCPDCQFHHQHRPVTRNAPSNNS